MHETYAYSQLQGNIIKHIRQDVLRQSFQKFPHYSLDTSYCIPFRTLSITHSSVFLVDHSISRISTQQWISRNLFTFGPTLIGTFLLN